MNRLFTCFLIAVALAGGPLGKAQTHEGARNSGMDQDCERTWSRLMGEYLHSTEQLCNASSDPAGLRAFQVLLNERGEPEALFAQISPILALLRSGFMAAGRTRSAFDLQDLAMGWLAEKSHDMRVGDNHELLHLGFIEIWDGHQTRQFGVPYRGRLYSGETGLSGPRTKKDAWKETPLRRFQTPKKGSEVVEGLEGSGIITVTRWVDDGNGNGAWWRLVFLPIPRECLEGSA